MRFGVIPTIQPSTFGFGTCPPLNWMMFCPAWTWIGPYAKCSFCGTPAADALGVLAIVYPAAPTTTATRAMIQRRIAERSQVSDIAARNRREVRHLNAELPATIS